MRQYIKRQLENGELRAVMAAVPVAHGAFKADRPLEGKEQQRAVIDVRQYVHNAVQQARREEPAQPASRGLRQALEAPQQEQGNNQHGRGVQRIVGGDPERCCGNTGCRTSGATSPRRSSPAGSGSAGRRRGTAGTARCRAPPTPAGRHWQAAAGVSRHGAEPRSSENATVCSSCYPGSCLFFSHSPGVHRQGLILRRG